MVDQIHQDIVLFCHQRHAFFFKLRQRDHGRRESRNMAVVFQFGFGFLDSLGQLFILLFTAGFFCISYRFGFSDGFSSTSCSPLLASATFPQYPCWHRRLFLRLPCWHRRLSLLLTFNSALSGLLGQFGDFCLPVVPSRSARVLGGSREENGSSAMGCGQPVFDVKPSPVQYSTGTGSRIRHKYHAAAVR